MHYLKRKKRKKKREYCFYELKKKKQLVFCKEIMKINFSKCTLMKKKLVFKFIRIYQLFIRIN